MTRGSVLVVSPLADADEVFGELRARPELQLRYVRTSAEVESELQRGAVSLLLAAAELSTAEVDALLGAVERMCPGTPLLVIRERQAEESPSWSARGVGVLRRPLVPEALGRSVQVVLGMVKP